MIIKYDSEFFKGMLGSLSFKKSLTKYPTERVKHVMAKIMSITITKLKSTSLMKSNSICKVN